MTKYILVAGGTCSSIGKGVISSTLGALLKCYGLKHTHVKIDPYINTDAGLLSPGEHGEVFVLNDGSEVDLDFGTYERIGGITLTGSNSITTGKIYKAVQEKERSGYYSGKSVQVVPHIIDEIITNIYNCSREVDVCIIELGGTIGDLEISPFLTAMAKLKRNVLNHNFVTCLVSYVPMLCGQKTKPTQLSVRLLREAGLDPDIIFGRCSEPLTDLTKYKIYETCLLVNPAYVISSHNIPNIYDIVDSMDKQRIVQILSSIWNIKILQDSCASSPTVLNWIELSERSKMADEFKHKVNIGIVGKYIQDEDTTDCYLSLKKALTHAGFKMLHPLSVNIEWIDPELLETGRPTRLEYVDGIIVPGGFGTRGIEGKILAIKYAREQRVPFLGICLGMQLAVVEIGRSIIGHSESHTAEVTPDGNPQYRYVTKMKEMRLGSKQINILEGTLLSSIYKTKTIEERHRHRYEVNTSLMESIDKNSFMRASSISCDSDIHIESVELPDIVHPFFLGVQFHPEFKTDPFQSAPIFDAFIDACSNVVFQ